jgi:glutamate/tyrosine decarboxylase-like PLP-dependent enzyme
MRSPPRRETPALLRRTAELAIEYLASLPERPVRVDHDVAAIRSSLWVPEYSRRARGFTSYAALRSLGRSGVREMVEQCCAVARRIAEQLAASEGVSVLNDVVFNQVLVHFDPPSGTDDGAFTRQVTRRVQEDGTCWLSGTTWHGTAAMRVSVSNWSTTAADADRTVAAILRCAREAALADGRAVSRG